jgi:hypothetical protein
MHSYSGGSGKIEVVQTESPLPLLTGPGTHSLYSIVYDSIPAIPVGTYIFDFSSPPPPALEISDPESNNMDATKTSCSVEVIASCEEDEDCDDGLFCNGKETCLEGDCAAGEPLDCNDNNPCTTDFCEEPSEGEPLSPSFEPCQHTPIPNCGGGRGQGGGQTPSQNFVICHECNNPEFPLIEKCCGINDNNAERFCRRPDAYQQFCFQFGQTPVQPVPEKPAAATAPEQEMGAMPAETYAQITKPEQVKAKVPAPKQHLAGKAITRGTAESQTGIMPWIIGGLVLVLMGIFALTLFRRRKPEQPEAAAPPEPPVIEEFPIEEPTPELKPAIKEPEPITEAPEPKQTTPSIIYKPVKGKKFKEPPLNKYEAAVRKRLAQAMRAKKRKK